MASTGKSCTAPRPQPLLRHRGACSGRGGDPQTIRDAVLARAARLSDAARGLLEAVAVVPPQAELWLLNILVGDAVERLEECLSSGMLSPEPQGVASGTSSPGSRSRSQSPQIAGPNCTSRCFPHSSTRRTTRTPLDSLTTPRRPPTPKRSCATRRPRPNARVSRCPSRVCRSIRSRASVRPTPSASPAGRALRTPFIRVLPDGSIG